MQIESKVQRNKGLDVLKCICAFFIVSIHAPFPGEFGKYFISIARIAVPIFFMITGFYYKDVINKNKENNQIIKIIKLIVLSNILYFILNIIINFNNGTLVSFFTSIFSYKTILKLLVFNDSPMWSHLWYLNSLLYVLIIYKYLPINKLNKKQLISISFILLFIDIIFGKYSLLILHKEINYIFLRNFIFVGFPYFTIGSLIREQIEEKKQKKSMIYPYLIVVFTITTLLERFLLEQNGVNATRDHYISTTLLSIMVFLYFYCTKNNFKILNKIGYKYSTLIYIIHPIVLLIISKAIVLANASKIEYCLPFMVFILSIIISHIYIYIKNNISKKIIKKD